MENKKTYKHLVIDTLHNMLLANTPLIGIDELVEIHSPDEDTPRQACGKILRKIRDPNIFVIHTSYDGFKINPENGDYSIGDRSVLRILARNKAGTARRRFMPDEKLIVNLEKDKRHKEKRVIRAKTGSVRKKKSKNKK